MRRKLKDSWTAVARRAIFNAQEEASRLGEKYVSTEHLLLGLVRENDSVAARILDRMGVSLGRVRSEIERRVTWGDGRYGKYILPTPDVKRAIDFVYEEAKLLGNNYIGTEHLLLGLIREKKGLAGQILAELGMELEQTRRVTITVQGYQSLLRGSEKPDIPENELLRAAPTGTTRDNSLLTPSDADSLPERRTGWLARLLPKRK